MDTYKLRTTHTRDAYRTYARVHIDARRGGGVMARAVAVLLGLVMLAGGVIAVAVAGPRVLYLLSIAAGLLAMLGRPLGVLRISRRLERTAANMDAPIDYVFGPDGFTYSSADDGGTVAYGDVGRIYETARYYFVYIERQMAHILAKADFTAGDPAAFGAFLSGKTGKSCQKLGY